MKNLLFLFFAFTFIFSIHGAQAVDENNNPITDNGDRQVLEDGYSEEKYNSLPQYLQETFDQFLSIYKDNRDSYYIAWEKMKETESFKTRRNEKLKHVIYERNAFLRNKIAGSLPKLKEHQPEKPVHLKVDFSRTTVRKEDDDYECNMSLEQEVYTPSSEIANTSITNNTNIQPSFKGKTLDSNAQQLKNYSISQDETLNAEPSSNSVSFRVAVHFIPERKEYDYLRFKNVSLNQKASRLKYNIANRLSVKYPKIFKNNNITIENIQKNIQLFFQKTTLNSNENKELKDYFIGQGETLDVVVNLDFGSIIAYKEDDDYKSIIGLPKFKKDHHKKSSNTDSSLVSFCVDLSYITEYEGDYAEFNMLSKKKIREAKFKIAKKLKKMYQVKFRDTETIGIAKNIELSFGGTTLNNKQKLKACICQGATLTAFFNLKKIGAIPKKYRFVKKANTW